MIALAMDIPQVGSSQKRLPPPFGKLSADARLLIALKADYSTHRKLIRLAMGLQQKQVDAFWGQIKRDRFGISVLRHGLPATFGEELPEGVSVQCPKCRRFIKWVPCVFCCKFSDVLGPDPNDVPFSQPTDVCRYRPGTIEKIEAMTKRVARGQSPFSDADKQLEDSGQ